MSFAHEHTFTVAASPAIVFAALTEAAQLRQWFAESVDVGQAPGAPFRFWGRHTLDNPSTADANQQVTRFEPDHALGFTWAIAGVPTEVTISLSGEGGSTKATVRQEVKGDLDGPRAREMVDDQWRLAFGNLMAHLDGGAGIELPDYTDPHPQVRIVTTIEAPVAVTFRSLVDPALVNQWFGAPSSVVEPKEGGRYALGWEYEIDGRQVHGGPTRILEYDQDRRLALDWPDWRGDPDVTGQSIAFDLEPEGDHTRVTFTHAGFGRTVDISDYGLGWRWFLGELARVAKAEAGGVGAGQARGRRGAGASRQNSNPIASVRPRVGRTGRPQDAASRRHCRRSRSGGAMQE